MATELSTQICSLESTLRQFTYRFTKNQEESQDLVQETILKALLYKNKFKKDTNLKGWLYTIMRNTFINNYRKAKIAKTSTDNTKDLYFLNVADSNTPNRPEKLFEFNEVWESINGMKDEYQIPFKMYTTGYKYHEIAEHLNIPIGTVKNRIFHARKEIQKNMIK